MLFALGLLLQDPDLDLARDYVRNKLDGAIYAYGEPRRIGDLAGRWLVGASLFETSGPLKERRPGFCEKNALLILLDSRKGEVSPLRSVTDLWTYMPKVADEAEARSAALFLAKAYGIHARGCDSGYGALKPSEFTVRATAEGWIAEGKLRDASGREPFFEVRFNPAGAPLEAKTDYKPHRH